jgi:hypothetical protein
VLRGRSLSQVANSPARCAAWHETRERPPSRRSLNGQLQPERLFRVVLSQVQMYSYGHKHPVSVTCQFGRSAMRSGWLQEVTLTRGDAYSLDEATTLGEY